MTANTNFNAPNPSLPTVGTATTNLATKATARAAAFEAAKAATADLHAAEDAYDQTITQLALYAENVTGGDPVKLLSANVALRNPPVPVTELGQVRDLDVITNGFPGSFLLRWQPLQGASLYEVQVSVDPATAVAEHQPSRGQAPARGTAPARRLPLSPQKKELMSAATFDPSLPVDNSEIRADELRNQFIGLMNRCDEVQANFDNYAARPTSVQPLSLRISNPPTQAQVQAISNKLDELLAALQAV